MCGALVSNVRVSGNQIKPVTGELEIWISEGTIFYPGVNWINDRANPNNFLTGQIGDESTPIEIYPLTQDGVIGAPITTLPDAYNPSGGTITGLTGNDATTHRLYSLGIYDDTREFILLYGQQVYDNADVAKGNIGVDDGLTNFPDGLLQES